MLRTTEKSVSIFDYSNKMLLSTSASRQILDFTQPTTYFVVARGMKLTALFHVIHSFRLCGDTACFLVGDSSASELCVPTFRNILVCSIFIGGSVIKKNGAKVWNQEFVLILTSPKLFFFWNSEEQGLFMLFNPKWNIPSAQNRLHLL